MRDLEGAQESLVEQFVRGEARDVFAIHEDPARGGRQAACDDVEKGGLARAVRPDEPGDGAGLDFQRGTVDGMEAAEMPVQVLDNDHVVFPCSPSLPHTVSRRRCGAFVYGNGPGRCPGRA